MSESILLINYFEQIYLHFFVEHNIVILKCKVFLLVRRPNKELKKLRPAREQARFKSWFPLTI